MVNIPKTKNSFCPTCQHHTENKVVLYKAGKPSITALGKRRYDKKQAGQGGQTRPKFHKNAKTTKKPVLKLECTVCHKKTQHAMKRAKHIELGGQRKTKNAVVTWKS